jgi:L-ascorbate metabolism protein UlaG (beta-lactamase superfamily)
MGTAAITWLGHATVMVEVDGVRLLTDPVLRDRVGPLVRIAPSIAPETLGQVDAVLLSHLHADHVDLPSLRRIARDTPVFAPEPAAAWLGRQGLRDVQDVRPGSEVSIGGVPVRATEADHDGARRPLGGPSAHPVGFVIGRPRSVYFAGDTDLFDGMAGLTGSIAAALLPVWGWGPTLGPGHLDPERAATAATLIAPEVAIPIHWGTFALGWPAKRPADAEQPARAFERMVKKDAPAVAVRVLAPGERTEI